MSNKKSDLSILLADRAAGKNVSDDEIRRLTKAVELENRAAAQKIEDQRIRNELKAKRAEEYARYEREAEFERVQRRQEREEEEARAAINEEYEKVDLIALDIIAIEAMISECEESKKPIGPQAVKFFEEKLTDLGDDFLRDKKLFTREFSIHFKNSSYSSLAISQVFSAYKAVLKRRELEMERIRTEEIRKYNENIEQDRRASESKEKLISNSLKNIGIASTTLETCPACGYKGAFSILSRKVSISFILSSVCLGIFIFVFIFYVIDPMYGSQSKKGFWFMILAIANYLIYMLGSKKRRSKAFPIKTRCPSCGNESNDLFCPF